MRIMFRKARARPAHKQFRDNLLEFQNAYLGGTFDNWPRASRPVAV